MTFSFRILEAALFFAILFVLHFPGTTHAAVYNPRDCDIEPEERPVNRYPYRYVQRANCRPVVTRTPSPPTPPPSPPPPAVTIPRRDPEPKRPCPRCAIP